MPCRNAVLWRLSDEHFLLHASAHFVEHFEAEGRTPVKDLADMVTVLERFGGRLNWQEFWRSAEHWRILRQAALVMATLREHWGFEVDGLPRGARPLSLERLALGWPAGCHAPSAATPRGYLRRLLMAGTLSGGEARLRYLFRLVVPSARNLRARYNLAEERSLWPYYAFHPFAIGGRFAAGLAA